MKLWTKNLFVLLPHMYRYLKPSYDPHKRYGIRGKYDLRGTLVKCACTWHNNEPVTVVNDIQAHFKKNKPHLGKCATP